MTAAHTYGEWAVEATCTAAGEKEAYLHGVRPRGDADPRHRPPLGGQRRRHPHLPRLRCHRGPAFNTNSALELRVVDAEGMDQPFTVSQNGTLRTYTGAYDTATLTGDLDTLRYLQDHGAQTIQFVTNGQTSSFAINDLLAQGSGSEVFYLTHRGAEEPTLLLVEADHSELVKD